MEPPEYQEGWNAFEAGAHIAANPYDWQTGEQAAWARGWRAAEAAKRAARLAAYKAAHPMTSDEDDDIPF